MQKIVGIALFVILLNSTGITFGQNRQGDALISQQELIQRIQEKKEMVLIDVRTPGEFSRGHIPGAINIPHTELTARLKEIPKSKGKEVVLYCESGVRAGIAEQILRKSGMSNLLHLEGDMSAWRKSNLPTDQSKR